jgi:Ca2+-binding EF-hand superfamily protein
MDSELGNRHVDGEGSVSLSQFEQLMRKLLQLGTSKAAKAYSKGLFDAFDLDANGKVSLQELVNGQKN